MHYQSPLKVSLFFCLFLSLSSGALASTPPPPDGQECASPRQAVLTLLVYLQDDALHNPGKAALCIDRAGLARPASEAAALAVRFKKVLDARGLYVVLEDLPTARDHEDSSEQNRYTLFPEDLPDMSWARDSDGDWLLTPASRDRIPTLYADTFPLNIDDVISGMPSWLRGRVIGVQIWQLIALLVLCLLIFAVHRLVLHLFSRYLQAIAQKMAVDWAEDALRRADKPIATLAVAGLTGVAFPALHFPVGVNHVAVLAARVLAAFSVVWLGYRMVDVVAEFLQGRANRTDSKLDDQLVPLIRKSLKLFLAVVGALFILQNLNVDVGSLLAGLGIGGLAFALAAKDTIANLFGSLMIFIDKPFQIGDWIVISPTVEGSVEEVGFRTTRIRTFYNSVITLPNSVVTNSAVDNMGMRRFRRYKASLGLCYDTPPEKVQAFCEGVRAIIQSTEGMRTDFYLVEFHSFGNSELNILVYCFMDTPDWNAELRTRTNLNLTILRLAQDLGVRLAYPSQSLYVESMPSDSNTASPVPAHPEALASIVQSFGPGGTSTLPKGYRISPGYEPGSVTATGSHQETDE